FYFDFKKYRAAALKGETPFTPAESIVFAAEFRAKQIVAEGVDAFVARHASNAEFVRSRVAELGLTLFPRGGAVPSNVVTAIEHTRASEVVAGMREAGFIIAGGQDGLKGRIFRLAHMGETTRAELVELLDALDGVVSRLGRA
ncbi:MAG: aminotransferase, partial [Candidatus Micrarchaeota archaeon]